MANQDRQPEQSKRQFWQAQEQQPLATELAQHVWIEKLQWNQDNLLPVICQDSASKQVLMLAWVNPEALALTLSTSQAHYWSRSRQALWRKGESSGNTQTINQVRADCDGDSLLYFVEQRGPACHTERANCFYWRLTATIAILDSALDSVQI